MDTVIDTNAIVAAPPPYGPVLRKCLKILVHDYAGHPFQVGLSEELAARGHNVIHAYFAQDSGPKGAFAPTSSRLRFVPLGGDIPYSKRSWLRRRQGDVAYGQRVAKFVRGEKPDLVLSGNTPTEAQERIVRACRAAGAQFVYWVQDVYSIAVRDLMRKKFGAIPAFLIGGYYAALDRRHFRGADGIVLIADRFADVAIDNGAPAERLTIIENWGDIRSLRPVAKDNAWAGRAPRRRRV